MSSERPKRARKIASYNEDHVHWKEEKQLQKALLRSLKEKHSTDTPQDTHESSSSNSSVSEDNKPISSSTLHEEHLQTEFLPSLEENHDSEELLRDSGSSSSVLEDKKPPSSTTLNTPPLIKDDNCMIRLTRLQSKLLEDVGMIDSPGTSSERSVAQTSDQSVEDNDDEMEEPAPKMRAQRKFASNSSSPQTRSESPVKMHRQKVHDRKWKSNGSRQSVRLSPRVILRPVRACPVEDLTESLEASPPVIKKKKGRPRKNPEKENVVKSKPRALLPGMPKTDSFLSYLCFRNTTVRVNLIDCTK